MGVAEDVGEVGAHRQVQPRVGVPGVLAAFVGVEETVQASSPVVIRPLVTLLVTPVKVRLHHLSQCQDVGVVSPLESL